MPGKALVVALLLALAVPIAGVAAASKSTQASTFGVTAYEWLYYNTQSCSSQTFYQLYRWEFRFQRVNETRRVKYRGMAGAEGSDCAGYYRRYIVGGDSSTYYIPCWGPCGNSSSPLWSRTQVSTVSGKPYVRATGMATWVGAWLDVHVYDSQWTEFGSVCPWIAVSGDGPAMCP